MTLSSVYAQYPTTKLIGKDTIVLLTLKQGNEINEKFSYLNDNIKVLKKKNDSLVLDLDYYKKLSDLKWQKENSAHSYEYYRAKTLELKIDSLEKRNSINKQMFQDYTKKSEVAIKHITVFATILGLMVMVFAGL